ncbi:MAG: hypothetical protein NWQ05_09450 [Burkholderiaceae bacterium]|jgi:hypothetical protein|nr:hypothetical protein [Burkholderiaceae bacterium]
MLGPDVVSAASRIGLVQAENRTVWVQTPVAQQLGLRDGQIVQATAEVRDQRVRLWLKDFFFDLPNGWVLKDGDKPFLRVSHNPGGWGFLIQAYPNGQAPPATATPVNQLFGLNPGLALAAEAAQPEPQSNRVGMLLMHPPGFATFSKLLSDVAQGSWGTQAEIGPWLQRLLQQRSSMAQINPSMLRKAVMGQARSIENILLQGQEAADDPKTLLKTLLSLLSEEGNNKGVLRQVEDASTEFEAAQAQSAQKMQQGELSLHVILPFVDADPVDLHFQRPPRKKGQEEPPLSVDIHSRSRVLGEVWLNTQISKGSDVDLVMWALRDEVAHLAKERSGELELELGSAGLQLQSFQIFNAPRPLARVGESSGTRGSVIDLRA